MSLSEAIRRLASEDPNFRDLLEDYNALLAELVDVPEDTDGKGARARDELLELRCALEDEILEELQRFLARTGGEHAE